MRERGVPSSHGPFPCCHSARLPGRHVDDLSFFPQAIKTLRSGDTTAISLRMYLLLSVGIACWGVYGFIIHDGPVMVANAITLLPALVVLQRKISQMLHDRQSRQNQQR